MRSSLALLFAILLTYIAPLAIADDGSPQGEIIHYESDGLSLIGYVYKPAGSGPFPVYIWNHGSDREPHHGANLAKFFVPRGFVLFAPIRSGHGDNPGDYIGDEQRLIGNPRSPSGFRDIVALHERANHDTVAAYSWIAHQPYADPKRIVVSGGSFGGIQVLLMAERDGREHLGVKCFVTMSPAAQSWRNPNWDPRLSTAVDAARAPIFLLQAQNDYDLGVTEVWARASTPRIFRTATNSFRRTAIPTITSRDMADSSPTPRPGATT